MAVGHRHCQRCVGSSSSICQHRRCLRSERDPPARSVKTRGACVERASSPCARSIPPVAAGGEGDLNFGDVGTGGALQQHSVGEKNEVNGCSNVQREKRGIRGCRLDVCFPALQVVTKAPLNGVKSQ